MSNDAKFEVNDLLPLALTVVVAGIGIAYGLNVLSDVKDDMGDTACADNTNGFTTYDNAVDACKNSTGSYQAVSSSSSFNASLDGVEAVAKFSSKLGLIVTVIVAAILIGVLVRYLLVK